MYICFTTYMHEQEDESDTDFMKYNLDGFNYFIQNFNRDEILNYNFGLSDNFIKLSMNDLTNFNFNI